MLDEVVAVFRGVDVGTSEKCKDVAAFRLNLAVRWEIVVKERRQRSDTAIFTETQNNPLTKVNQPETTKPTTVLYSHRVKTTHLLWKPLWPIDSSGWIRLLRANTVRSFDRGKEAKMTPEGERNPDVSSSGDTFESEGEGILPVKSANPLK